MVMFTKMSSLECSKPTKDYSFLSLDNGFTNFLHLPLVQTTSDGEGNAKGTIVDLGLVKDELEERVLENQEKQLQNNLQEDNVKASDMASEIKEEIKVEEQMLIDNSSSSTGTPKNICELASDHSKEPFITDKHTTETKITWNIGTGTYTCKFCPHECKRLDLFLKHQKERHPDVKYKNNFRRVYKCTLCDCFTFHFKNLTDHKRKMHGKIKCRVCRFTTDSKELFKSHMWEHENHERCAICCRNVYLTFTFLSRQVCTQCKKEKTEAELRSLLANSKPENKEFEQVFLTEDGGNNFQGIETGIVFNLTTGTYTCKFCPYKSSVFDCFIKHQSEKHPNKVSKEYADQLSKCSLCDEYFYYKDLIEHRENAHGRIKCGECSFTTNSAELIKSHMWEHENNKICDICGENEYLTLSFFSRQVCTQCKKGKTETELRALLANLKPGNKVEFEQVFLREYSNKNGGSDD